MNKKVMSSKEYEFRLKSQKVRLEKKIFEVCDGLFLSDSGKTFVDELNHEYDLIEDTLNSLVGV